MSLRWSIVLAVLIVAQAEAGVSGANDPPPGGAKRVIEGRCVAGDGQAVRGGRIYFKADDRAHSFLEAWSAPLDGEGRYRVELADAVQRSLASTEMVKSRAAGPLRFEVIAPGFRAEVGPVAAEPGTKPLVFDVRLTAQAWRETEFRLVDAAGQPVPDGEVALELAASPEWAKVATDPEGRCRVATPPGRPYGINARRPGSIVTSFVLSGTADQPTRIAVPIRAPIVGRVLDLEGKPVADLQIGRLIAPDLWAEDAATRRRPTMLPFRSSEEIPRTDADGRFTLRTRLRLDGRSLARTGEFRLFPTAVCLADAACRQVAFLAIDWKNPRPAYDLTWRPTRRVRFPVAHSVAVPAGKLETGWELNCETDALGTAAAIFVMSGMTTLESGEGVTQAGDWVEAYLPPGKYQMQLHSADPVAERGMEEATTSLVIPAGDGPLLLPAVPLSPLVHDQMEGRDAPEIDARDLDTGAPVRLAELKGRVVVLDFWGYWCGPCLGALPELMAVHEQFKNQPVTIIALHDQSIQSRAAFDTKLGTVRRQMWHDRDLPFRVALDHPIADLKPEDSGIGGGVTCGRYDIHAFPTTFIIDQAGQVAGTVSLLESGKLATRIKELLAAPAPR